eukprot:331792-Pyramimonas_sp.AAC.1
MEGVGPVRARCVQANGRRQRSDRSCPILVVLWLLQLGAPSVWWGCARIMVRADQGAHVHRGLFEWW